MNRTIDTSEQPTHDQEIVRVLGIPVSQRTYLDFAVLSEAYLKTGGQERPLFTENDADKPWAFVQSCTWYDSGRAGVGFNIAGKALIMDTRVAFHAPHPTGLIFSWSSELLSSQGNRDSIPTLDVERYKSLMIYLRQSPRAGACRGDLQRYARWVSSEIRQAATQQRDLAERFIVSVSELDEAIRGIFDRP